MCHSVKDLTRLGFAFDFQNNQLKWDSIIALLVPKGFWNQHRVNDFWRDVNEGVIDAKGRPKGQLFDHFGTLLEASTHEKVDMTNVLTEEKHGHSDESEKEKWHAVMKKHEQLFDRKKGVWKGQDKTLRLKDGAEPPTQKLWGVFPQ